MGVNECYRIERKESTKCCEGNGCWIDSAEHKGEGRALIGKRIAENNAANVDRRVSGMLERIVKRRNLNRAYKWVKKNKGAGGINGMTVDELLQYLKENARNSGRPCWEVNTNQRR